MNDLEALKQRKELLELQKQVAKLERDKNIGKVFNSLPWKITIPLSIFGLILLMVGIEENQFGAVIIGALLILPLPLKFFSRK